MVLNTTGFANASNLTGFVDIINYANVATGYIVGDTLLIGVFVVTFLALKNYPTERAFTTASFLTFLSAVMLSILGLAGEKQIILSTIAFLAATFMMYYNSRGQG